MVRLKDVLLGLCIGVLLLGCAGFSFRYYGLSADSYDGKLLGPDPKDDLPLSTCSPTPSDMSPCVVLKADEFLRLKEEYTDVVQKLKDCQAGAQAL